ncbi:DNA-processing protein DprA [Virgibacillus sp. W0181]|uniref:DNA-processing protein DprA n=1 Tax=Virgibacillus sp. W0181 TaxID=3391581 RepID=UPI003F47E536
MNPIRNRLIHVYHCRGISRRKFHTLIQHDSDLKEIYTLTPTDISHRLSIPFDKATSFYKDLHDSRRFEKIKQAVSSLPIITIYDSIYPAFLKTISDPPIILYANGNVSLLNHTPSISVIGTRNPSRDAFSKMEYIIRPLVDNNWLIVSGMAKGIDSYAHQIALKYGGHTIAVLGGGFEHIYPKQNIHLFRQISRKGLVLSEYSPSVAPQKYHFPERNRIISGLSFGTLVVEAKERSGTMITVDQALEQGREVYALPGSPLDPQTKGCHQMIQEGAKLVIGSEDITEDWNRLRINVYNL